MAFELAKEHLAQLGLVHNIRVLDESSATVALAAQALGCEEKRIAKSLSFKVHKASMLTPDEAVEMIGHAVGGVCPFGIKDGVRIYLDESLRRFDFVYPACGSSNSAVKLTLEELERACGEVEWVDVGKNWQPTAE